MRQPWTRLQFPREGQKPYEAFVIYRDMGSDRSIDRVKEKVIGTGKKKTGAVLNRWSAKFNWVNRAAAYDAHLDEVRRKAAEKEVEDMARRHASNAQAAMTVLMQPVTAFIRKIQSAQQEGTNLFKDFTTTGLLELAGSSASRLASLVTVERISRGLSTENLQLKAGGKDEFADFILGDPEGAEIASRLLQRISNGEGDAGRGSEDGEQSHMALPRPSGTIEPPPT